MNRFCGGCHGYAHSLNTLRRIIRLEHSLQLSRNGEGVGWEFGLLRLLRLGLLGRLLQSLTDDPLKHVHACLHRWVNLWLPWRLSLRRLLSRIQRRLRNRSGIVLRRGCVASWLESF